jgi:hypothetical protein
LYRIHLTYGNGPTQMKWTIQRDDRDFLALHNRLRLLYLGKRDKLPDFPQSTFPFWLGNFGGLKDIDKSKMKEDMPLQLGIAAGIGAATGAVGGGIQEVKKQDMSQIVRTKLQEYLMELALFLVAPIYY